MSRSNHSVTNAHQFVDKLRDVILEVKVMVSFDVAVLFTSIDLSLEKKMTKKFLQEYYPDKPLGK